MRHPRPGPRPAEYRAIPPCAAPVPAVRAAWRDTPPRPAVRRGAAAMKALGTRRERKKKSESEIEKERERERERER